MAVANKIKLPSNTIVDINDSRINTSSVLDEQSLVYDSNDGVFKNGFPLAGAIPFGSVTSASTSTLYVVNNLSGVTELKAGIVIFLYNGVVNSAGPTAEVAYGGTVPSDKGCRLNVNGLGAKPLMRANYMSTVLTTEFVKGYRYVLIYNTERVSGGCWDVIGLYSDSNTIANAYSSTAASTAAKTASSSGYALRTGSYTLITFANSNSKAGALTLNINGTGNRSIYINGQASSSSNYTLPSGTYFVYYDGTNYYLRTDGKLTINGNVFGGSYNDLTDKPTIPDAVSGVTDGTNWTSLTIGNTTKAIPAEQVQSDWYQNDSGSTDFVKNRTHWEDTSISRTCNVLEIAWDSFTTEYANGVTQVILRSYNNEGMTILGSEDIGIEVEIVINGATYHATTYDSFMFRADGSNPLIESTFVQGQPELDDSMYDILFQFDWDYGSMFILYFPTTVLSTVTSLEVNVISSIVHKLDDKYINTPNWDAGYNYETATADPGYIENRTHYRYQDEVWKNIVNTPSVSVQNGVMRIDCYNYNTPISFFLDDTKPDGTYKSFDIEVNGEWYGTFTPTQSVEFNFTSGNTILMDIYSGSEPQSSIESGMYYVTRNYDYSGDILSFIIYVPTSDVGSTLSSLYVIWPDWAYQKISMNYIPIYGTNNGTNWTELTIGDVTKSIPSGGLSNYDFTHTANTTVNTSTKTITFAANTRGSQMITIYNDLGITFAVNNNSDNYLWIHNSSASNDVDITVSSVTHGGSSVSHVYMPSDGISVPKGGYCEISIIVNSDGAFITSRNDLE